MKPSHLLLVVLALAPACTIDLAPNDRDDPPSPQDPEDVEPPSFDTPYAASSPVEALLAIGTAPEVEFLTEGWAVLVIDDAAFDCGLVSRARTWLPVRDDLALQGFNARHVNNESGESLGWLTLERDDVGDLWHITELTAPDDEQPPCYTW